MLSFPAPSVLPLSPASLLQSTRTFLSAKLSFSSGNLRRAPILHGPRNSRCGSPLDVVSFVTLIYLPDSVLKMRTTHLESLPLSNCNPVCYWGSWY